MSQHTPGWRPLQPPQHPGKSAPLRPTQGFAKLARVQVLSAAGDAMIAVALAGSLFFSIDPSAARWRVGLYLAFTVAPFAVIGPVIGPALDRSKGGRRIMMTVVNAVRAVAALLMISNIDSFFLFPLAFVGLVAGKSYAISKAAFVPTVVRHESELVNANSRLALLTGIAGLAGAAPAALASLVVGPPAALALATVTFAAATIATMQLPSTTVAAAPPDSTERLELRSVGIRLAGSAMGVLRGIVGYLTFLVAFAFRGGVDGVDLSGVGTAVGAGARNAFGFPVGSEGGVPAWQLGVVVGFSVVGMLAGSLLAPRLRQSTPEENILLGVLVLLAGVGLFGAWSGDLIAAVLVSFTVGLAASAGKLAFDSIVQRDAPDANYGRSFARFETRFQVYWVLGALLPVVFKTPAALGFLVVGVAAGVAALTYFLGSRNSHGRALPAPRPDPLEDVPADLDTDLRPSYPKMNLRSPVRMPTGWVDEPGSTPPPPSDASGVLDPHAPTHHDGAEPPATGSESPPLADFALPETSTAETDETGNDDRDDGAQLPLWDE